MLRHLWLVSRTTDVEQRKNHTESVFYTKKHEYIWTKICVCVLRQKYRWRYILSPKNRISLDTLTPYLPFILQQTTPSSIFMVAISPICTSRHTILINKTISHSRVARTDTSHIIYTMIMWWKVVAKVVQTHVLPFLTLLERKISEKKNHAHHNIRHPSVDGLLCLRMRWFVSM